LQVDVAGPYVASQNLDYYGANDIFGNDRRPRTLVSEAITLADPSVNFANYDNDLDGWVDGVYVIYAGYGEEAGAPANTIWAHAWSLSSAKKCDGVYLQRYSCSSELRGTSGTGLCRIGVICHEFGHVLGSPDFYDTDYFTNGQYQGTGFWDLMASGSWNNNGATPAHFTGLVKVRFFNWATETVLSSAQSVTLNNAEQNNNSFYRINTTTTNEYFFLENREKHLFDANIPGKRTNHLPCAQSDGNVQYQHYPSPENVPGFSECNHRANQYLCFLDVSTSNKFSGFVTGYIGIDVGGVFSYQVDGLSPRKIYYYRVRAYNPNGTSPNSNVVKVTTLGTKSAEIVASTLHKPENTLLTAWPNPFHNMIAISYSVPEENKVSVEVFDIQGRLMKTLVHETQQPGDEYHGTNGGSSGVCRFSMQKVPDRSAGSVQKPYLRITKTYRSQLNLNLSAG
jgi:M6 family metalloprotease-like protein